MNFIDYYISKLTNKLIIDYVSIKYNKKLINYTKVEYYLYFLINLVNLAHHWFDIDKMYFGGIILKYIMDLCHM